MSRRGRPRLPIDWDKQPESSSPVRRGALCALYLVSAPMAIEDLAAVLGCSRAQMSRDLHRIDEAARAAGLELRRQGGGGGMPGIVWIEAPEVTDEPK